MKKVILGARVCLYAFVLYMAYDMFFKENATAVQLNGFQYQAGKEYVEYFMRFNQTDSDWVALQTKPLSGAAQKFTEPVWEEHSGLWAHMENRNLRFVGVFLDQNLSLTKASFFTLCDRINELPHMNDSRLKKLHKHKSVTLVFERL